MKIWFAGLRLGLIDVIVTLDDKDGDEVVVAVDYAANAHHVDGCSFASSADHAVLDVED